MTNNQIFDRIPTLQTDRLILRPVDFGDEEQIYNICLQPEVQEFTNVPSPYTLLNAKQFVARKVLENLDSDRQNWHWAIVKTSIVGGCGFHFYPNNPSTAVIGYLLSKDHWGQGLVPEAVARIIRFGFENLPQIEYFQIAHAAGNPKSGRVAQKLGFSYDGTTRGSMFVKGVLHDTVIYSISREEWQVQRQNDIWDKFDRPNTSKTPKEDVFVKSLIS